MCVCVRVCVLEDRSASPPSSRARSRYVHYLGQWLFLKAERVPLFGFLVMFIYRTIASCPCMQRDGHLSPQARENKATVFRASTGFLGFMVFVSLISILTQAGLTGLAAHSDANYCAMCTGVGNDVGSDVGVSLGAPVGYGDTVGAADGSVVGVDDDEVGDANHGDQPSLRGQDVPSAVDLDHVSCLKARSLASMVVERLPGAHIRPPKAAGDDAHAVCALHDRVVNGDGLQGRVDLGGRTCGVTEERAEPRQKLGLEALELPNGQRSRHEEHARVPQEAAIRQVAERRLSIGLLAERADVEDALGELSASLNVTVTGLGSRRGDPECDDGVLLSSRGDGPTGASRTTSRGAGIGAGATASGDMAVRLANHKEEPVSIGLAGVRGLGDAAVLLSISPFHHSSVRWMSLFLGRNTPSKMCI